MSENFSQHISAIAARFGAAVSKARRSQRRERSLARQRRAALARLEAYREGPPNADTTAASSARPSSAAAVASCSSAASIAPSAEGGR